METERKKLKPGCLKRNSKKFQGNNVQICLLTKALQVAFITGMLSIFPCYGLEDKPNEHSFINEKSPYGNDENTFLLLRYNDSKGIINSSDKNYPVTAENILEESGKFGKAMVFNGKNSHAEIPNFRVSDHSVFTIEFWIKPKSSSRKCVETIFQDGTVVAQVRLTGALEPDGRFSFAFYDSNGKQCMYSRKPISSESWTNITIVAEKKGYARLYVNGVLEDVEKVLNWGAFGCFKMGTPALQGASYFNGAIDGFRVSNVARIGLPPQKSLSEILDFKAQLKAQENMEMEKQKGYIRWPKDIADVSKFTAMNGCSIENDGSIIFAEPGAWATYNFYVSSYGHYRIMIRALSEKDKGEIQVHAKVSPITSRSRGLGGLYLPKYGDNKWHWHEMNTPYSLLLEEGWVSLQITFQGRENGKTGALKLDAVTLTAANDYTKEEMGYFRTSAEAAKIAEKMQAVKYRMVQLEYPFFYEIDINGKIAKTRAFNLMKEAIERDIAPNGFNWIVLSAYGNGSRMKKRGEKPGVSYPSKIPYLTPLINEEEDCISEIISLAHKKGIKVAFYMPYAKYFKNTPDISLPKVELMIANELVAKYKPDGLAYEDPTSDSIWKDIKKINPKLELFTYTANVSPANVETESEGNWNCITMDNLDYPEEIFPPIVCLYAADQKVMDPVKFNNLLQRMLKTPGVRGYYLYYISPTSIVEPYASVLGTLYHGSYSKALKWTPEDAGVSK